MICTIIYENVCTFGKYSKSICNKNIETSLINKRLENDYIVVNEPIIRTDRK